MLEFDDLTPLEDIERFRFDLYIFPNMQLIEHAPEYGIFYKIRSGLVKTYMAVVCCKTVAGDTTIQPYTDLQCTLRRGHKGKCTCYHPDEGPLDKFSRNLLKVAESLKPA